MTDALIIRPEQPGDAPALRALIRDAFLTAAHASHTEHLIVDALREADALTLSLVATSPDGLHLGHVAASPVTILTDAGSVTGWLGIAPLAVHPDHQRRGVGAALMRAVLHASAATSAPGCVLLGDPGYYARFGFTPAAPLTYPGPPPQYFQALRFTTAPLPAGQVRYHQAFEIEPSPSAPTGHLP